MSWGDTSYGRWNAGFDASGYPRSIQVNDAKEIEKMNRDREERGELNEPELQLSSLELALNQLMSRKPHFYVPPPLDSKDETIARLTRERDMLMEALRPFSAAYFNDNHDVTISTGHLTWVDYEKAHAAIAAVEGK